MRPAEAAPLLPIRILNGNALLGLQSSRINDYLNRILNKKTKVIQKPINAIYKVNNHKKNKKKNNLMLGKKVSMIK